MRQDYKNELQDIVAAVSDRLKTMYAHQSGLMNSRSAPGLIFPVLRDDSLRLSEQEARTLFVNELNNRIKTKSVFSYYSIETPTRNRYAGFSKNNKNHTEPTVFKEGDNQGRSASIDLSIYADDIKKPCINIEFKSGTTSKHNIEKDILKLYAEEADGAFIHIYKGNQKTFETIEYRILETSADVNSRFSFGNKQILVFIVCINNSGANFEDIFMV